MYIDDMFIRIRISGFRPVIYLCCPYEFGKHVDESNKSKRICLLVYSSFFIFLSLLTKMLSQEANGGRNNFRKRRQYGKVASCLRGRARHATDAVWG